MLMRASSRNDHRNLSHVRDQYPLVKVLAATLKLADGVKRAVVNCTSTLDGSRDRYAGRQRTVI